MSNVHVVKLSSYTTPEIVEDKRSEFVAYGDDNNYFQYLIDRYIGSTTNNAIINGMVRMIYGKGIDATDSSRKPDQYAQMKSLIGKNDLRSAIFDRKVLGMCALLVTYKSNGQVGKITHFPMHTLRPEKCNEEGDIEAWYYHPDWANHKKGDELKRIPSFGFGAKKGDEVYIIRPYCAGFHYFAPVDYQGALPYALLEQEIADYLINDTLNGFSGTKVVNFNNGVPDREKQEEVKNEVLSKLTGARGHKVIVAFNDNQEGATTVDDIPLNNAPEHYQYLADECFRKLIVGHRVTSPMLLGVRDGNSGLGNNADEIKNATLLFDNLTIKTYQEEFTDALDEILAVNYISLNIYFKTIQPLEFTDTSNALDAETKEEETGVKLSTQELTDEEFNEVFESLSGEQVDEEWELVDKRVYSAENDSVEDWAARKIKPRQNALEKLAAAIKSNPSAKSYLDKDIYKVRYSYEEKYSSLNSREFCRKMMTRTANGVVYRKEDIDQASFRGVNQKFGHNGRPYSLFKYKGGVNCGHFWAENLYRLKKKTDGTYYQDKALSSSEEVDEIKGYNPKPEGIAEAKIAPKDMPNNGAYPS